MTADNNPLQVEWTETPELPDSIETEGHIQNVESREVQISGDTVHYVDFTVIPHNKDLQGILKDGIRASFPVNVHDESMLGRFLKRSNLKGESVDLAGLEGARVRVDMIRTERKVDGKVRRFWEIDRETMKVLPYEDGGPEPTTLDA